MKTETLTKLATDLAESTKAYVARRVSALEGRIVELEARKQLDGARIAALEVETEQLRATLEARTSLGLDATTKQIYRSRQ